MNREMNTIIAQSESLEPSCDESQWESENFQWGEKCRSGMDLLNWRGNRKTLVGVQLTDITNLSVSRVKTLKDDK